MSGWIDRLIDWLIPPVCKHDFFHSKVGARGVLGTHAYVCNNRQKMTGLGPPTTPCCIPFPQEHPKRRDKIHIGFGRMQATEKTPEKYQIPGHRRDRILNGHLTAWDTPLGACLDVLRLENSLGIGPSAFEWTNGFGRLRSQCSWCWCCFCIFGTKGKEP